MVTDAALHRLVDMYRTYDATLCAMLCKRIDVQPQLEQNKPTKNKKVDPYAGIFAVIHLLVIFHLFVTEPTLREGMFRILEARKTPYCLVGKIAEKQSVGVYF